MGRGCGCVACRMPSLYFDGRCTRRTTAVHEAGHAVVHMARGRSIASASIDKRGGRWQGLVCPMPAERNDPAALYNTLLAVLGGPVAELRERTGSDPAVLEAAQAHARLCYSDVASGAMEAGMDLAVARRGLAILGMPSDLETFAAVWTASAAIVCGHWLSIQRLADWIERDAELDGAAIKAWWKMERDGGPGVRLKRA